MCAQSSPKASSAFTARISWAWAFCRCNSKPAKTSNPSRLTGEETYDFPGLTTLLKDGFANGRTLRVKATGSDGKVSEFNTTVRIDTPQEILYYQHGGILQYVLRQLAAK